MTREEILKMEPGNDLDMIVAEKVMGWKRVIMSGYETYVSGHAPKPWVSEWNPSTDLVAAWEVVNGIDSLYAFELGRPGDYYAPDDKWRARFGNVGWAEGETAPLAICRAALLSVIEQESNTTK